MNGWGKSETLIVILILSLSALLCALKVITADDMKDIWIVFTGYLCARGGAIVHTKTQRKKP